MPRNWEIWRRLRRAETEATIAAERIEIARILAGIASCQLRNAALDHGPLSSHPGLHAYHEQLLKTATRSPPAAPKRPVPPAGDAGRDGTEVPPAAPDRRSSAPNSARLPRRSATQRGSLQHPSVLEIFGGHTPPRLSSARPSGAESPASGPGSTLTLGLRLSTMQLRGCPFDLDGAASRFAWRRSKGAGRRRRWMRRSLLARDDRLQEAAKALSPYVRSIWEGDWRLLREIRLRALLDSPDAFASSHDQEVRWDENAWRVFLRGARWTLAFAPRTAIGMAGVVDGAEPSAEPHVISMWVDPGHRRTGVARLLLTSLTERMVGRTAILLWVMQENLAARRAYERMGFVPTCEVQRLPTDPSRYEERMRLCLADGEPAFGLAR